MYNSGSTQYKNEYVGPDGSKIIMTTAMTHVSKKSYDAWGGGGGGGGGGGLQGPRLAGISTIYLVTSSFRFEFSHHFSTSSITPASPS